MHRRIYNRPHLDLCSNNHAYIYLKLEYDFIYALYDWVFTEKVNKWYKIWTSMYINYGVSIFQYFFLSDYNKVISLIIWMLKMFYFLLMCIKSCFVIKFSYLIILNCKKKKKSYICVSQLKFKTEFSIFWHHNERIACYHQAKNTSLFICIKANKIHCWWDLVQFKGNLNSNLDNE